MAQRIRRETTNLEIAGSNPAGDDVTFFFFFFNFFFFLYYITLLYYIILYCYEKKKKKKIEGTTGFEPVTSGSAIPCSAAELRTHLEMLNIKKKKKKKKN